MKKIIDVRKGKKGIKDYKVEGIGWVEKQDAINMVEEEELNVIVVDSKKGNKYLRSKPDNKKDNNLSFMLSNKTKIYFTIYYKDEDKSFQRAAETWKYSITDNKQFKSDQSVFIMKGVKTENEFKTAWKYIFEYSHKNQHIVMKGNIFTHASKSTDDTEQGLEFISEGADATITKSELSSLPELNWYYNAILILSGCNTGVEGQRGWSPAEILAKTQNVKTLGQKGYSYFSTNKSVYHRINAQSRNVYLRAYKRGKNGLMGDGKAIKEKVYNPK